MSLWFYDSCFCPMSHHSHAPLSTLFDKNVPIASIKQSSHSYFKLGRNGIGTKGCNSNLRGDTCWLDTHGWFSFPPPECIPHLLKDITHIWLDHPTERTGQLSLLPASAKPSFSHSPGYQVQIKSIHCKSFHAFVGSWVLTNNWYVHIYLYHQQMFMEHNLLRNGLDLGIYIHSCKI